MLPLLFAAFLLVRAALGASQAASLISSANQLPAGTYRIRNVGTGQYLVGNQRDLYAGSGIPTRVYVAPHTDQKGRHTVMGVGARGNTKCVSASWSYQQNANGQGSLYACQLGPLAQGNQRSTLRHDKQAFILISASKAKRQEPYFEEDSDEDSVDEAALDEPAADADEEEFADEDEDAYLFEKRARRRKRPAPKKSRGRKQAKKPARRPSSKGSTKGGFGPYYIIATDHINDQKPRALDASSVTAMGQRVMKLVPWQKGSTKQQWLFVR